MTCLNNLKQLALAAHNHNVLNVDVNFQAPPWSGNYFAASSSVLVLDSDGVFPDPIDVDLGPAENGNAYLMIP